LGRSDFSLAVGGLEQTLVEEIYYNQYIDRADGIVAIYVHEGRIPWRQ